MRAERRSRMIHLKRVVVISLGTGAHPVAVAGIVCGLDIGTSKISCVIGAWKSAVSISLNWRSRPLDSARGRHQHR